MSTPRAVRLHDYGHRDALKVEPIEIPEPAEGQVVLEVKAAGINPGEAAIREGAMKEAFPSTFPSGQGSDLAGVVIAVGEGVTDLAEGDEVLGWSFDRNSQSTHVAVPADQLVPKPAAVSWEVAGALYVVGATAVAAVDAIDPTAGETVVVSAAAGGVGSVVTQLLAARDVTVVGIASESNADWLREHGAVQVAYGDGLADRVREAAPDGVDALIDTFGPDYLDLAVELGVAPDRIETIISFEKAGEIGAQAKGSQDATTQDTMTRLAGLVADGSLTIEIAATYPIDRVADAFEQLEARHTRGKIVLTMG